MIAGTQVGTYRVLRQIGAGGMGSVWLAEHTMLGRRAAIKVLHANYSAQPDIVTRFFNEARAATAISDPGIVQVFDFGHHTDGSAYIVMEMLEGETLAKRFHTHGPSSVEDAIRVVRQVAASLGAAHARGIVHRDLKPENIFLVPDAEVIGGERTKILDFGIAKLVGDQSIKTNTAAVMGTPTYMSPEQCRGAGKVDQRSDVYSLGCVLFTLLTGRPPFEAEGVGDIIAMHLREEPPVPSSLSPRIPPELDPLILRCLAKDPAARYDSGRELAAALSIGAGRAPVPSVEVPPARPALATARTLPETTLSGATGATGASSRGRRPTGSGARLGLGLAVAVLAAGVVVWAAAFRSGADESATGRAKLAAPMTDLLTRFAAWSREHAGAPCPTAEELGTPVPDAWGHPLRITCGDQPKNQIAGAISAGPDGRFDTSDDIGSWQLDHDVTDAVSGPRWAATPPPPVVATSEKPAKPAEPKPAEPKPAVAPKPATPKPATPKPATPKPADPNPVAPRPVEPRPAPPKLPDPIAPTPPAEPVGAFALVEQTKLKVNKLLNLARTAASQDRCDDVRSLATQLKALDATAYHDRMLGDAAFAKCLTGSP